MSDALNALSPLDGRYLRQTKDLRPYFSEAALQRHRVLIEVEWLIFLCNDLKLENTRILKKTEIDFLRKLYQLENFTDKQAQKIKDIEKITNHDVKSVEYYIADKIKKTSLEPLTSFLHFACTSEDITNLSYSLMLKSALNEIILPSLKNVLTEIKKSATRFRSVPMLSHTHGQPASPTTVGKEFYNFYARLERQYDQLKKTPILGKINGAVGNYNAHLVAYPKVNWAQASTKFIKSIGLTPNLITAQIEPHDNLAEIFDNLRRINTILIDLDRDLWTYISFNYFKQKVVKGEVGSSTMPHKVNPINFENSEGNLGLANALCEFFNQKLPISRMQRDLSDSTVLRNLGTAFSYSLIGYQNFLKGLAKLELNRPNLEKDLDTNWEVLAEPLQTVMRKHRLPNAYEKLKELTRGKRLTQEDYQDFVASLKLPATEKERLKNLTPAKYIGIATKLF